MTTPRPSDGAEPGQGGMGKGGALKEKPPSPYETTRGRAAMNIFGITKFDDITEEK